MANIPSDAGFRPLFTEITLVETPGGGALHRAAWQEPGRAGPRLMAADEALLQEVRGPALRIYGWERPWLSIGYFEKAPTDARCPVVRRWTGGGVVHHRPATEWTYALSVPRGHPFYGVSPVESYRRIHQAVEAALRACGIACHLFDGGPAAPGGACFVKPMPGDVLATDSGEKLAGAGQRRHRSGLLHQGSIQLAEPVGPALAESLIRWLAERVIRDRGSDEAVLRQSAILAERYETTSWLYRTSRRQA